MTIHHYVWGAKKNTIRTMPTKVKWGKGSEDHIETTVKKSQRVPSINNKGKKKSPSEEGLLNNI